MPVVTLIERMVEQMAVAMLAGQAERQRQEEERCRVPHTSPRHYAFTAFINAYIDAYTPSPVD